LAAGRIPEAEHWTRTALAAGSDDSLLCLMGEIHFRRGNLEEAAKAFDQATRLNPESARAWWGLARIEEIHFRREKARCLFSKAYMLDPLDPEIILSYLNGISDTRARTILLRNVVELSRQSNPERAAWAMLQLEIDVRLGGKRAARLTSEYRGYRVPLSGFRPVGANQDGLIVMVRLNGGKPLRLLLDTGARGILVDARAAKNLGLEPIAASQVAGFGESGADSQVAVARRLTIGDAEFADCLIEVSRRSITSGADGILGTGLFEAFRVRVDARAATMELQPTDTAETSGGVGAIGVRNLLLVKTSVGSKDGWFLVDTGAAFTTVAQELTDPVSRRGTADLIGVQGAVSGAYRLAPLSLGIGGRQLVDTTPVSLDLGPLSRREGIEISGVLGYRALSRGPLTVDYRRGLVSFE
jgi:predicted aspartyl protease